MSFQLEICCLDFDLFIFWLLKKGKTIHVLKWLVVVVLQSTQAHWPWRNHAGFSTWHRSRWQGDKKESDMSRVKLGLMRCCRVCQKTHWNKRCWKARGNYGVWEHIASLPVNVLQYRSQQRFSFDKKGMLRACNFAESYKQTWIQRSHARRPRWYIMHDT